MSARVVVHGGEKYNKLTIIEEVDTIRKPGKTVQVIRMVRCRCECGNETVTRLSSVRGSITKSCGCLYYGSRSTQEPPPIEGARWIALTRNKFCLVDEGDHEWLVKRRWQLSCGYAKTDIRVDGKARHVGMHRMIMVGDSDPGRKMVVDHIDRNPLNNRRTNLRLVPHAMNLANSVPRKGRKYKGVFARDKKWEAKLMVNMKLHRLGCTFPTAEDAARAYNEAAIRLIGPTAWLNPVEPLVP